MSRGVARGSVPPRVLRDMQAISRFMEGSKVAVRRPVRAGQGWEWQFLISNRACVVNVRRRCHRFDRLIVDVWRGSGLRVLSTIDVDGFERTSDESWKESE